MIVLDMETHIRKVYASLKGQIEVEEDAIIKVEPRERMEEEEVTFWSNMGKKDKPNTKARLQYDKDTEG